ncbi:MAG: HD domain-containing protein [Armatimonadota bacterium]|nr:HD domain-containing protein [Armatimonadota bacterium]
MSDPSAPTASPIARLLWAPPSGAARRAGGARPGDVLRGISRIKRTRALYGIDHPVSAQTLEEVHGLIQEVLASRPSLRLSVYEDTFFVGNTVLLEESLQLFPLLAEFRERDIGTLDLHEGVEVWEVHRLIDVLQMGAADLRRAGGAAGWLQMQGVTRLSVGPPPKDQPTLKVEPRDAYRSGLRAMDEVNFQASRRLPLDLRKTKLVVKSFTDIIAEDRFAMLGLAALKGYDEDTCHHSVNVGILSLLIGSQLEFSRPLMATLGLAALLHDLGKMLIPREILGAPRALTLEEQDIIKRHTLYGARLMRGFPGLARLAMVVAFEHHANYDLSGYPRVTVKRAPHLLTRIVQLADFFDAATSSRRLYRRPMLPVEAMRHILDGAGKSFDPVLARIFVQVLGLYPVGSVVELDTDEVAVVIRPGEREAARPVVKVVRNAAWREITPYTISLEEDRQRRILRALDPVEAGLDVTAHL